MVSDEPIALRDSLLGLGFFEDLLIPGDRDGAVHHASSIGRRVAA